MTDWDQLIPNSVARVGRVSSVGSSVEFLESSGDRLQITAVIRRLG